MHLLAYSLFFLGALAFVLASQRLDHGRERAKPTPSRTSPPREP